MVAGARTTDTLDGLDAVTATGANYVIDGGLIKTT